MTTPQQYQHENLSNTSTNGGTKTRTGTVKKEVEVDCASTYNQDEISSSGNSPSTETQLSEDPSVHILHRISLPSNDDVMDSQVNKKTILNSFATTSGTGGHETMMKKRGRPLYM